MFLFCNHALITKVSTLLDIYKGCQRRQVQNRMGHIQISITTKIIIFLKSGRKTFKTIFCALSITEKYINLVNILRKKRASPLQVWCLVWIARCAGILYSRRQYIHPLLSSVRRYLVSQVLLHQFSPLLYPPIYCTYTRLYINSLLFSICRYPVPGAVRSASWFLLHGLRHGLGTSYSSILHQRLFLTSKFFLRSAAKSNAAAAASTAAASTAAASTAATVSGTR